MLILICILGELLLIIVRKKSNHQPVEISKPYIGVCRVKSRNTTSAYIRAILLMLMLKAEGLVIQ